MVINNILHKDDILETALNSGVFYTAKKYNITIKEVYDIVNWFKEDIEDNIPCSCERSKYVTMCFMCDKGVNERIKI